MSEPETRATRIDEILPGVFHWSVHDDRLDHRSEAYAVRSAEGLVLVDPLPLTEECLARLEREGVAAACMTGGFHQRSAWRLADRFGVETWAPRGAAGLERSPDRWYDEGDALPGGLRALHAPGPTAPHACFLLERPSGNVLFGADLLMRGDAGSLAFVPDDHQDDPARTREAARGLLRHRPEAFLPAHGAPLCEGGLAAMEEALAADAAGRGSEPRRDGPGSASGDHGSPS